MVPVIILMVVAIGVAFALLAIVDTQTSQSREQRSKDSAQTLAEGAVSSTANVLADTASAAVWRMTALRERSPATSRPRRPARARRSPRSSPPRSRRASPAPRPTTRDARADDVAGQRLPGAERRHPLERRFLTRTRRAPAGTGPGVGLGPRPGQRRAATERGAAEHTRAVASKVTPVVDAVRVPPELRRRHRRVLHRCRHALNTTTELAARRPHRQAADRRPGHEDRRALRAANTLNNLRRRASPGRSRAPAARRTRSASAR